MEEGIDMARLAGSPPVYYQKGSDFKGENWRVKERLILIRRPGQAQRSGAQIQDPLPQGEVWRGLVVTIPHHDISLG